MLGIQNVDRPRRLARTSHSRRLEGSRHMRHFATVLFALLMLCATRAETVPSRIKDLVDVEGVRQNQLVGYGLVVGLNGTGDTLNNTAFTKQSLTAMLERLG